MKRFFTVLNERFFSTTYQVQRIVIWTAIVLVVAVASFGSYYYYDRYYVTQPTIEEVSLSEAEQAVRDEPDNISNRLRLAEGYLFYRRYDDAINQALLIKEAEPDNLGADFVLGVAYANNGNPAIALDPLIRFIESRKDIEMPALDKNLQTALYYLGDSYLQLGRPEEAIEPFEITLGFVPVDADSLYKLGLAYSAVQRYEDAILAFHKALAFVPNFMEVYEAMSQVYTAQNMTSEANYADAMVLYCQTDYDQAYAKLAVVVQEKPAFAPAFTGMGMTCEAQGNLECALNSYQAAAQLDPNDLTASQGVARVQLALQK